MDFYVLAIAADLRTARMLAGRPDDAALREAAEVALRMHRLGVSPVDSGWVFEPGALSTHPDYAYAGQADKMPGMATLPVPGIAWDASHFSRWPLFLLSHAHSWPGTAPERRYYDGLRRGLEHQFFACVLVPPTPGFAGYRTRNFMDGRNGVYRWGYRTHPDDGYGPFQLSGTLFYGWWAFLGSARSAELYRRMAAQFPVPVGQVDLYRGVRPTQPRFTDGRHELSSLVASYLRPDNGGCMAPPGSGGRMDSLWSRVGPSTLRQDFWLGASAEEVQYDLMVPLHGAFWCERDEWVTEYRQHFARFRAHPWPASSTALLPRMHYVYFASRFLVLAREARKDSVIPGGLDDRLEAEWRAWWFGAGQTVSNTGWGEPPFAAFRDYLSWKLNRGRAARGSTDTAEGG